MYNQALVTTMPFLYIIFSPTDFNPYRTIIEHISYFIIANICLSITLVFSFCFFTFIFIIAVE